MDVVRERAFAGHRQTVPSVSNLWGGEHHCPPGPCPCPGPECRVPEVLLALGTVIRRPAASAWSGTVEPTNDRPSSPSLWISCQVHPYGGSSLPSPGACWHLFCMSINGLRFKVASEKRFLHARRQIYIPPCSHARRLSSTGPASASDQQQCHLTKAQTHRRGTFL